MAFEKFLLVVSMFVQCAENNVILFIKKLIIKSTILIKTNVISFKVLVATNQKLLIMQSLIVAMT